MAAGYEGPNYTQIPNALLDEHMADMSESELRVTLAIARKTFGWHKQRDQISLSQLMELTGMSRQGVVNGVDAGLERGTIHRQADGQSFEYILVVNEVDQSTKLTRASQRSRPELVNEVDTQKKGKKYKEKSDASLRLRREESPAAHRSPAVQEKLLSETNTAVTAQQEETLTPPIASAPPSPSRRKRAKASDPRANELWKTYLEMIETYEPKIVLAFGRERKGINELAKAGRIPDELAHAFHTLKKDNFRRGTHLSAQSLGQQMGAVLAKAEPQEAQVIEYAW